MIADRVVSKLVHGSIRQETGKVADHLARVVFDAVDERRFATPEHRQAQRVQTWTVDDAAVVAQVPFLVQDGDLQPAVFRVKSGGPEYRAELAAPQIDLQA